MNNELMVTISCMAYNHESYIRQCLDGFVMQKTNFRFEAIVHDDASTDGTATIIKEYAEKYPDIIKPIFETENQYSKRDGSLTRIMNSYMHGKYIAICEGDDYWIDPLKLQKQVDFLENHLDYGLVRTDINKYLQNRNEFECGIFSFYPYNKIKDTYYDYLYKIWFIAPCTWLFRKQYIDFLPKKAYIVGDLPLLLTISKHSKVKYLSDVTSVYRVLNESASHFTNDIHHMNFLERIELIQYDFGNHETINVRIKLILHIHLKRLLFVLSRIKRYIYYYVKGTKSDLLFLLGYKKYK